MTSFLTCSLQVLCILIANSCSPGTTSSDLVFVGSTPGDELIKSLLAIPSDTRVDFIRWDLTLKHTTTGDQTFELNIVFGESQPNTLGFRGGGEKRTFEGAYRVSKNEDNNLERLVYQLNSNKLPTSISMVQMNDNLLHLLTPQNHLMIGNGGWSYTLNRKEQVNTRGLPSLTALSDLTHDTILQLVFVGRTPCQELAAEHSEMKVSNSCFKLKWKLTLNRDSVSHAPSTYTIRKVVDNIARDVSGKWTVIQGIASNPRAMIYQLDPENPETSISFFVADDNHLFFLNKANNLHVGNGDFSFTLNREIQ